ncbi:glycoside hydrolase family 32 protein [Lacrimispora sp. JR3]|uniref:glycoside hydrolase family 32 protein n=1 Tax=Lacrimispora sinapis TaxID=3111456 RepID=UPI0037493AD1
MSKSHHLENIKKAQKEINAKKALMKNALMRQRYHFMAEEGWLNDPNGLIFFRGKYHFFYQYNPYDSFWGSMHWGHAVSDDLLHWDYLPVALAPSEPYDDHKEGGCFSGSAIEHDGKLFLIYTGTANYGDGFVQTQCVAYSEDGIHFEKYEKNPVITAPKGFDPANFRDPKVWEHEGRFYLVCGAKKDDLAKALLYRSDNLLEWEFVNVMAESRGELGNMFECPDFFPIEDKYVLMFSPMGLNERTCVYLVGDMDYKTGTFYHTVMGEIDWGFDYYAPQSFLDAKGRRLIVGWANAWDWMPFWKDWGPTYKEHWCGSFAIPRQVRLMPDNTLQFLPVEELKSLRTEENVRYNVEVEDGPVDVSAGDGVAFECRLVLDLERTTAETVVLELRSDGKFKSVVCLDLKHGQMTFDRNQGDGWSRGQTKSPLKLLDKKLLDIHFFSDQSSIEVFSSQYQTNHSCNVFASNDQNKNTVRAFGGRAYFTSIISYGMERAID